MMSADYSSQMSTEGPVWVMIYLLAVLTVLAGYSVVGAISGWKSWSTAAIAILPMFFEYKRAVTRMDFLQWLPGVLGMAAIPTILMVVNARRRKREGIRWLVALILLIGLVTASNEHTKLSSAATAAAGLVGLIVLWMIARAFRYLPGERLTEKMPVWATSTALFTMVATVAVFLGSLALPKYPEFTRLPPGPKNFLKLLHLKSSLATPPDDDFRILQRMIAAIGQARVDVYPWKISMALMNGLRYSPRFVLQSYQAYNPPLDARCADHFRGKDSPEFILYSHDAIGSTHPWIVDPQTWLEIYRWYDIADESGDLLLLRRRGTPRWEGNPQPLDESRIELGERWELPRGHSAHLLLKAHLDLTATGKLVRFLHRILPPTIRIEFDDGKVDDRTIVWRNAQSGFLVSDLPRDVVADTAFFRHGVGSPVRAVTFLADRRYFTRQIHLQWEKLPLDVGVEKVPETVFFYFEPESC